MIMNTLPVFTKDEYELARQLLAAKVSTMMGRKMEEGDWSFVYTNAKKIPDTGWSNLHIDIIHNGLGVEHKMMRFARSGAIKDVCGTSLMHPSATRSIRISSIEIDPNEAAREVLFQYGELIEGRAKMVREGNEKGTADMRYGWLIWKDLLDEFLYFEVPMTVPNPDAYYAEWNETSARGSRKATKNLWIYEKETGHKRYSVTTVAGAKVQPYFDVPPPTDPNLYYFKVQGNEIEKNLIEIWITNTTAKYLELLLGNLDVENLSQAILNAPLTKNEENQDVTFTNPSDIAIPVVISKKAYLKLISTFEFISDEYLIQQFALNFKK